MSTALLDRGRLGMQLPHSPARVDSGCVQFGNDWPGVFIRGDHCLIYEANIRAVLRHPDFDTPSTIDGENVKQTLQRLVSLLKSSEVS